MSNLMEWFLEFPLSDAAGPGSLPTALQIRAAWIQGTFSRTRNL
jgi:hypothetical protein